MELKRGAYLIDTTYEPNIGDVLSTDDSVYTYTIQKIYKLNRMSYRKNKKYNEQLDKYYLWQKIITRKEIIWEQHKFDRTLFPDTVNTVNVDRINMDYRRYLALYDYKSYCRLFYSRWSRYPDAKIKVKIGDKTIVTLISLNYGNRYSISLNSLIKQNFSYHGNIYTDIISNTTINLTN